MSILHCSMCACLCANHQTIMYFVKGKAIFCINTAYVWEFSFFHVHVLNFCIHANAQHQHASQSLVWWCICISTLKKPVHVGFVASTLMVTLTGLPCAPVTAEIPSPGTADWCCWIPTTPAAIKDGPPGHGEKRLAPAGYLQLQTL